MLVIIIKVGALARLQHQMNLLGPGIARDIIGQTRLHAADHHHQTFGNPIPLRDLLRQLPLIHMAGIQILVRPPRRRRAQGRLLDLLGQTGLAFSALSVSPRFPLRSRTPRASLRGFLPSPLCVLLRQGRSVSITSLPSLPSLEEQMLRPTPLAVLDRLPDVTASLSPTGAEKIVEPIANLEYSCCKITTIVM